MTQQEINKEIERVKHIPEETPGVKLVNRIKMHRARLDITQGVLAEEIGVSRETLGGYERGSTPDLITALKLAGEFGISIHELFELQEENQ